MLESVKNWWICAVSLRKGSDEGRIKDFKVEDIEWNKLGRDLEQKTNWRYLNQNKIHFYKMKNK